MQADSAVTLDRIVAPASSGIGQRSPRRSPNTFCENDEAVGSRADKIERMTGNQGQCLVCGWTQYRDFRWIHDSRGHHTVAVLASQRRNRDQVVLNDPSERPEERVAVPGKPRVAKLSRQCRAGYVADGEAESVLADSLENDRRKTDARDLNAADHSVWRNRLDLR